MSSVESSGRFGTRLVNREWQTLITRWERLQPCADRFATAFFDTLFAADPDFRQIFGSASLEAQFLRFAHLLAHIVSATDDPEELDRRIAAIVRRFARDDSETDRSRAVRAAIASMLEQVEMTAMTASMLVAWKTIDRTVTEMRRGTTWVGARTIRQVALHAEVAADRRSAAVEDLAKQAREVEAA
jgi:hemoglobin-like flavoprotein